MFETKTIRDIEFDIYTEIENGKQRKYYNFTKYIKKTLNNKPQNIFNSKRIIIQMMEDIINKNIEPPSNIIKCKELLNKVRNFKGKYTTGINDCINTNSFKLFKSGDAKYQGTYGPIYLIDFFIQQFDSNYRLAIHELMESIQMEADNYGDKFEESLKDTTIRINNIANDNKLIDTCSKIEHMTDNMQDLHKTLQHFINKHDINIQETEDAYDETIKYNNEEIIENVNKRSQLELNYDINSDQLKLILDISLKPVGTNKYLPIQEYKNKLILRQGKRIIELTRDDIFMNNNKYLFGTIKEGNIRISQITNKKELLYLD